MVNPNNTNAAAVARVRSEIDEARLELHRLRAAPLPADELRARAAALIAELAEAGKAGLKIERGALHISWRRRFAGVTTTTPGDVASFAAWLFRDALIAALEREIEAIAPSAGVSGRGRAERMPELEERTEEALIEQAEGGGQTLPRRPQASRLAVLGLRIVSSAARAA